MVGVVRNGKAFNGSRFKVRIASAEVQACFLDVHRFFWPTLVSVLGCSSMQEAPCPGSLCSCARWLGLSFLLSESCFCLAVATDAGSEMLFKPCIGASLHQRRLLSLWHSTRTEGRALFPRSWCLTHFTKKKEKEKEVGRLGRMTEGSEPVGSSLFVPAQGPGTSRRAVGSP